MPKVIQTTPEKIQSLRAEARERAKSNIADRPVYMNHKRRCAWMKSRQQELKSLRYTPYVPMKLDKYMVIRRRGDDRDCYQRMFRHRRLRRAPAGWEIVWVTGLGNPFATHGFLKPPFNEMPILPSGEAR